MIRWRPALSRCELLVGFSRCWKRPDARRNLWRAFTLGRLAPEGTGHSAALGAKQRDIRKLVFAEGFRLIAGGVLSGIAAARFVTRTQVVPFEVEPTDPATLMIVGSLFAGVALLACWVPVRRAAGVDPLEALRYE